MPVQMKTNERKTRVYTVIVGSAEISLTLSEDIDQDDLTEFVRALREAAVLNAMVPPISNVANLSAPREPTGEWANGNAKSRPDLTGEMFEAGEDWDPKAPTHNRTVSAEPEADPEPEEAKTPDPLVEAAKKIATEAVTAFGAILKKALEDL
jgi:hypothetical protein